jgi:hypothetical protein
MLLRAANETKGNDREKGHRGKLAAALHRHPLTEFGEYVLLTNFDNYVEWFATVHGGLVKGVNRPMPRP